MPTQVAFVRVPMELAYGVGAVKKTGEYAKEFGKKALVVTDKGVEGAGLLEPVLQSLKEHGIAWEVFDEVEQDPSVETAHACLERFRASGADLIVGVGGGSSLDTAKACGVLATNGGRITDYEGVGKVPKPAAPVIGIPTTAGTGSELTINLVITDRQRQFKFAVIGKNAACRVAIDDPVMTLSMPPGLTASTGLDALTHAIESYTSVTAHPFSEALALEAVSKITGHLRQAVANGRDLEERDQVLQGVVMASIAFSNTRLGNAHAMAHPLGARFRVPHGVANAILLPHVMWFNVPAVPHKFAKLAQAMGERVDGLTLMEAAYKAVEAVQKLSEDVGIPKGIAQMGVTDADIDVLAEDSMKSGNIQANPRVTTKKDIVELFKRAM